MKAEQVRPRRSTTHSNHQPMRFGTARSTMSTRMCCPRRRSQGAVSIVTRYSIASEISFDHSSPARPGTMRTFLSSTSAQIMSVMPKTSAHAARANASSILPYAASSRSIAGRSIIELLRQDLSQLLAVLRARLDRIGPADLFHSLNIRLARGRVEADGLDAGFGLALGLLLVVSLPEVVLLLVGERLAVEILARLGGQRLVLVGVHHQRFLGIVETGVDAELRLLLPVEVEEGVDRPAVAVDHAALERGVNLPRRRGHHLRVHRLEELAVHRRDPDLHAGEVGLVDLLVDVEVERRELDHLGEVAHVGLLRPDLVDELVAAVPALLGGAGLGQLEDVGFRHDVGIEGARAETDIDHAGLHRLAHFEGRDRLGPADEIDLRDALAVLVEVG